jgi:hypothetical protein
MLLVSLTLCPDADTLGLLLAPGKEWFSILLANTPPACRCLQPVVVVAPWYVG